ncbi:MAG: ABC transporter substrate-binding protein [Clostridia bacterium]|nr:ABC transporter substrate-binding protein [Clostridia bacterium]
MKRILAVLLSLMMLGSLLSATAVSEADDNTLRFGTDAEPIGFDPHTISAVASLRVINQLYNTLIDVDEDLNVIPELAESWEQPDDVTYVFHLRDDVTFHNGRKMTAEDVKYSFERILTPDAGMLGNSASYAGNIDTVEAVDDYTVTLTLNSITAPFLASLSSSYCSIVCKEVVEEHGDLLRADAGTGPYTLGEWVPDNVVRLNKYDGYFLEGKPHLDMIEYYVMTDSAARLAALRTGVVDVINADTAMLSLVTDDANINTLYYQTRNYVTLCLNVAAFEPFKDARVRQAVSLAINREEIIDMAFNGEAEISGFVPASMGRWAVDVSDHPLYQQNVDNAKALMDEAGYTDGFEVELIVGLLDTLRDMGVVVQQQLAEIGVRVNVVNKENAEYVDLWGQHAFEMMACQNGAGSDPSRGVAFFFKTGNTANIAEYSNARVDELCDLGAGTTDPDEREGYYKEAIEIILDECPNVTVCSPREYFLASPRLQGFTPSASTPYALINARFE